MRIRPLVVGATALLLTVTVAGPAPSATKKATTTKKPVKAVAGGTCTTVGARSPGTTLDCVRVNGKLQWQPKGSKLNPFKIGETFEWTHATGPDRPGTDKATFRMKVLEYLPDASALVSSYADNNPEDIFDQAGGKTVRGVRVSLTLVSTNNESTRLLQSLSSLWLGNDAPAGSGGNTLNWGPRPDEFYDSTSRLDDGETKPGVFLFGQVNEQLTPKPLMRLAWLDIATGAGQSQVWFVLA